MEKKVRVMAKKVESKGSKPAPSDSVRDSLSVVTGSEYEVKEARMKLRRAEEELAYCMADLKQELIKSGDLDFLKVDMAALRRTMR